MRSVHLIPQATSALQDRWRRLELQLRCGMEPEHPSIVRVYVRDGQHLVRCWPNRYEAGQENCDGLREFITKSLLGYMFCEQMETFVECVSASSQ